MSSIIGQNSLWIEGYPSLMLKNRSVCQAKEFVVLDTLHIVLTHLDTLHETKGIIQRQRRLSPQQCDMAANQVERLQTLVKELCHSINLGGVFRAQSILSVLYKIDELTDEITYHIYQLRLICLDDSEEVRELYAEIKDDMNILMSFGDLIRRDTSSLLETIDSMREVEIH